MMTTGNQRLRPIWLIRIDAASPPDRPLVDETSSFSLRLFGGASIESSTGPLTGRAVQRRRLGLLAMLATTGGRGMSREKLLAHLWPESNSDSGRHLLSDSVYRINQALGHNVLVAAGNELRLNPHRLSSDVAAFESAVAATDLRRAVALYSGPFMDGFILPDCGEFERWLDGKRAHYAYQHARALETLAEEAERAGTHTVASFWWRTLAAHDACNSRVALRLMQSLDAVGERVAALQLARDHANLLEREFRVGPDPDVVAFADRMSRTGDRA